VKVGDSVAWRQPGPEQHFGLVQPLAVKKNVKLFQLHRTSIHHDAAQSHPCVTHLETEPGMNMENSQQDRTTTFKLSCPHAMVRRRRLAAAFGRRFHLADTQAMLSNILRYRKPGQTKSNDCHFHLGAVRLRSKWGKATDQEPRSERSRHFF